MAANSDAPCENDVRVTVLIPAYNVEDSLREGVESIFEQGVSDIQVLIVDDGSTDGTLEVARSLAAQDTRVTVLHQENAGAAAARNAGVLQARGEWICFVDADDRLLPGALRTLLACAAPDPRGCVPDIVVGDFVEVDGSSRRLRVNFSSERTYFGREDRAYLLNMVLSNIEPDGSRGSGLAGAVWARIYRRAFLVEHELMSDVALRRSQDIAFNLHCFDLATCVACCHEPVYEYRINSASATRRHDPESLKKTHVYYAAVQRFMEEHDAGFLRNTFYMACVDCIPPIWRQMGDESKRSFVGLCQTEPFATAIRDIDDKPLDTKTRIEIALLRRHIYFPLYWYAKRTLVRARRA